jgi:hypothetical protein
VPEAGQTASNPSAELRVLHPLAVLLVLLAEEQGLLELPVWQVESFPCWRSARRRGILGRL